MSKDTANEYRARLKSFAVFISIIGLDEIDYAKEAAREILKELEDEGTEYMDVV